jgi:hypothetical protein
VSLLDLGSGLFVPQSGDTFEILTATGGVSGAFTSVLLPTLGGGHFWQDVEYGDTSVSLSVAGVPGDYNLDSVVDAADYTVWRDTRDHVGSGLAADGNGDGAVNDDDLSFWRARFGQGPGTSPTAEVPEPISLLLIIAACTACVRARAKSGVRS